MRTETVTHTDSTLILPVTTLPPSTEPTGNGMFGHAVTLVAGALLLFVGGNTLGETRELPPQTWYVEQEDRALQLRSQLAELSLVPTVIDTADETAQFAEAQQSASVIQTVQWLKEVTALSDERLGYLLGISRPTLGKWERDGGPIRTGNLEHLLAVADVIRRAQARQPSVPTWLYSPRGADGRHPMDILRNREYDRARAFAVTTPSPGVRPSPRARRPIAARFAHLAESRGEPLRADADDEPLPD